MKYDLFVEKSQEYICNILEEIKKSRYKYHIETREEKINGEYSVIQVMIRQRNSDDDED